MTKVHWIAEFLAEAEPSKQNRRGGLHGLGKRHQRGDVFAADASILHELPRAEKIKLHHARDGQLGENEDQVVGVSEHGQRVDHGIARGGRLERHLKKANHDHDGRQDRGQIEAIGAVASNPPQLAKARQEVADQRPGHRRPEKDPRLVPWRGKLLEHHLIDQRQAWPYSKSSRRTSSKTFPRTSSAARRLPARRRQRRATLG